MADDAALVGSIFDQLPPPSQDAALVASIVGHLQPPIRDMELSEQAEKSHLDPDAVTQNQDSGGAAVGRPVITETSTRPPVRVSYAAAAKPASKTTVSNADPIVNLLPNLGRIPPEHCSTAYTSFSRCYR